MHGAFDRLSQDVRGGMRSLLKYPVSCAVAVVSLAGGIGATTATLMIRDVVFLRPPALCAIRAACPRSRWAHPSIPSAPSAVRCEELCTRSGAPISASPCAAVAPEQIREVRTDDRREGVRIRRVTPNFLRRSAWMPRWGGPLQRMRFATDRGPRS